jgi:hypothetical protein
MKMTHGDQTRSRPGANRTGLAIHPQAREEMLEVTTEFRPTSQGGVEAIAAMRMRYARHAEPHGTMPPTDAIPAERLPILDRLGARLAFERTGVRLYEALISKHDAYGSFDGGPARPDLEVIRGEEHQHMLVAQRAIKRLGGDPTVITPQANLQAIAGRGILDVLVDPRTNLVECLETILIAELTDHESWSALARAARALGDHALVEEIARCEATEDEHLRKVRAWVAAADSLRAARAPTS